jgi:hypothetical protein
VRSCLWPRCIRLTEPLGAIVEPSETLASARTLKAWVLGWSVLSLPLGRREHALCLRFLPPLEGRATVPSLSFAVRGAHVEGQEKLYKIWGRGTSMNMKFWRRAIGWVSPEAFNSHMRQQHTTGKRF